MSAAYEGMVDYLQSSIQKRDKDEAEKDINQKAKRPLKMPKNYDFSVRNVDWKQYKDDYLLRTDAVWEKSKLMEIVKFDEEKEEEKTLLVTEDTKAEVVITDNRHL